MTDSLKNRLYDYLKKVYFKSPSSWIAKGDLETKTKQIGYLGDNGDRRLRELCEDGKIERRQAGISIEYRYCESPEEIIKQAGL